MSATNPSDTIVPSLEDPLLPSVSRSESHSVYDQTIEAGLALRERPLNPGIEPIIRQHAKRRMTIWERINVLTPERPDVLFENWGPNLDGASLVTAILRVGDRDVACYGHDFTVRAGSMDATNGKKLARLFQLAGEKGIPLVGINDSAGAYVPAGVGGLDGYAEAFTALRKINGVVPSIMCMFGFNAGGGSYLPRQGSFVIQPADTFFGLTGPGVVKSVLGEDVTPDDLGGPKVHGGSGVADLTVADEVAALRISLRLLSYLPSNNRSFAPIETTSDPIDRATPELDTLLRKTFDSPSGFNTPFDISLLIQQVSDHGDFFEIQPGRARNMITAFARLGGQVVGWVANNSAVASGQIDVAAAYKAARFIRFCNLYNIPVIFVEDTTGFLPGKEQETLGIVQAGRAMLDAIVDLRTPRILLLVRNAFGGAYASFNNYPTGADLVLALPTTRVAVMGPAGKEFVYKDELRKIRVEAKQKGADWLKAREAELNARYERELMNPREALSLGSISRLCDPKDLRSALGRSLGFFLRHYTPSPMCGPQREFH
jgi:acetyl-CoA carboxylase carboxyltransferase component